MSARTHTRPHPAPTGGGVEIRLPWWALVLPAIAFVILLTLILNPSDAHAATSDPGVGRLLERAQDLVLR
ncbi:hypothetical protein ACFVT5_22810 [Streptomyces sp. NPDC058001]|uniref:hypothetical protein n=1 Tax=Streptomyces sp. NPDC058001 TaxID=3346300 RepID=UPI0036EB38A0